MRAKCIRLGTHTMGRCTFLRADRGTAVFEFALVAPLLLTLLIGMFWIGRAYNIYETITRAAREGARTAVVRTCASCSPANAVATDDSIQTAVFGSLQASGLDATKVTSSCLSNLTNGVSCEQSYCTTGSICIIRDYPLNSGTPQELGVVVSFSYPVNFPIPFVNISPITVSTWVQMREEN